jgi:hypothetical protein
MEVSRVMILCRYCSPIRDLFDAMLRAVNSRAVSHAHDRDASLPPTNRHLRRIVEGGFCFL